MLIMLMMGVCRAQSARVGARAGRAAGRAGTGGGASGRRLLSAGTSRYCRKFISHSSDEILALQENGGEARRENHRYVGPAVQVV